MPFLDELDAPAYARRKQQGSAGHALVELRPMTLDRLRTARNCVEFADHGGRYDDVLTVSESSEGRSARKR